jgi:hypothetical protein
MKFDMKTKLEENEKIKISNQKSTLDQIINPENS